MRADRVWALVSADELIAARDALLEGRADVEAIADAARPSVHDLIADLCARLTARAKANWPTCEANWTIYAPDKIAPRARFVRIVASSPGISVASARRSVWAFVEISNGLVWKSASWKAPALNYPRGCVFDAESLKNMASHVRGVTKLGPYHAELA